MPALLVACWAITEPKAAGDEAQVAGLGVAGAVLHGCDLKALLGEVLGSAGVIGHGGDGRAVLQTQLAVLGVAGGQGRGVVEDVRHELVHVVAGHVVASQDHRAHGHGGGVGMLSGHIAAVVLLVAAGDQAQRHDQRQNQCKKLFHVLSPCRYGFLS